MLTESCLKVAQRFSCDLCDYHTDKKSSYDKHLTTSKHIKLTNVNILSNKSCHEVAEDIKEFICNCCNKSFKSRVGLWKHKQKCNQEKEQDETQIKQEETKNEIKFDKELFMMLINQNKELLEIVKNGTPL